MSTYLSNKTHLQYCCIVKIVSRYQLLHKMLFLKLDLGKDKMIIACELLLKKRSNKFIEISKYINIYSNIQKKI